MENQNQNQQNPFDLIGMELQRLNEQLYLLTNYINEFSKADDTFEDFEKWSDRVVSGIIANQGNTEGVDLSVKRKSGIVLP